MLIQSMRIIGISLLVLIVTSFIGILLNLDVWLLSFFSLLVTYIINGILSAKYSRKYPYFISYMTAVAVVLINILASQFIIGLDMFLNPEVINFSLIMGVLTSLLGTYIKIYMNQRRVAHG